ncbi:helix-turn-helix domain-containing protein [Bradyrhizobium lablabi]|uniref:helix-turn-helix domain-containing protein n=1 Tax=Bradyrhizobium lablabi TaxID=722472 RepID=UPI001BA81932|nr:helix-turn-helix domain-containing protein [Bradyrhizobium lablabi]MBR0695107.1 helix-turn-helix domain-containing protein [Bradyrhizobium lablabi]
MQRLFASFDQLASAKYSSGAEIFGEGDPAEHIYQVVSGAVRTQKLLSDDRRQIGAFYLPGDIFGLEDVATHRFTAEAITSTTVHLAKRECLDDVVKSDPSVLRIILAETNRNLMHVESHLLLLGRQNSLEKVAAFLLEMRLRSTEADVIHLPMTRRDIADYLGLALETVSRVFADLRSKKILRFDANRSRKVVVLDAKALADLAE